MKKLPLLSLMTFTAVISATTSYGQQIAEPEYIRTEKNGVKVYQSSGYKRDASQKTENLPQPISTTPNVNTMMMEECRDYLATVSTKMDNAVINSPEYKHYREQKILAEKRIELLMSTKN